MTVTYEQLKQSDVDAVQALHSSNLTGVPPDAAFYLNMRLVSDCLCVVAKEHNQVVGFVTGRNVEGVVHILTLAVKEECRRRKLATTLVKELLKVLANKNDKATRVEMHSGGTSTHDNPLVKAFAESLGLSQRLLPDHLKADNGTIYHGELPL